MDLDVFYDGMSNETGWIHILAMIRGGAKSNGLGCKGEDFSYFGTRRAFSEVDNVERSHHRP